MLHRLQRFRQAGTAGRQPGHHQHHAEWYPDRQHGSCHHPWRDQHGAFHLLCRLRRKVCGQKGQQEGHRNLDLHQHGHHRCANPVLHLHGYPSDRRDGQLEHDRLRAADPAAKRLQYVHHHLQHLLYG